MEITEKGLLLGTRSNLDITDIDCNDRDAQLCTVYAQEIYNNLRVAEVCDVILFFYQLSFLLFIWHFNSWSLCINGGTQGILHFYNWQYKEAIFIQQNVIIYFYRKGFLQVGIQIRNVSMNHLVLRISLSDYLDLCVLWKKI